MGRRPSLFRAARPRSWEKYRFRWLHPSRRAIPGNIVFCGPSLTKRSNQATFFSVAHKTRSGKLATAFYVPKNEKKTSSWISRKIQGTLCYDAKPLSFWVEKIVQKSWWRVPKKTTTHGLRNKKKKKLIKDVCFDAAGPAGNVITFLWGTCTRPPRPGLLGLLFGGGSGGGLGFNGHLSLVGGRGTTELLDFIHFCRNFTFGNFSFLGKSWK